MLENYAAPADELPVAGDRFKIARYARGMDYHLVTHGRLHRLAEWLKGRGAGLAHVWLDDGPVPERELAERAGLGWIGKNTMLIHPRIGSWTFIGTVFTDLPLDVDAPIDTDRCGSCTRCLDACPTSAFVDDRLLDATQCLSYLTIEYKNDLPVSLLPHWDGWAFGCDVCNSVCPWNEKFADTDHGDGVRSPPRSRSHRCRGFRRDVRERVSATLRRHPTGATRPRPDAP